MPTPSTPAPAPGPGGADQSRYSLGLEIHDGQATLVLGGDLDAAATEAIQALLELSTVDGELQVRAEAVTGADADLIDSLLELALKRTRAGRQGVVLVALSDAVADVLRMLGLPVTVPVHLG